jgi:spermidine synthase
LFTDDFYRNCARILTARGLVVNQCGVPFMQAEELAETSARRRKFFPHVSAYAVAVPTYVGGLMTLGIAAKDASVGTQDVETIRARAATQGIGAESLFWTPEIHVGSFHLPPYIACHLG